MKGGKLELADQMGNAGMLEPFGVDAFRYPGSEWVLAFTRDGAGKITGFGASTARTRDMRFEHTP